MLLILFAVNFIIVEMAVVGLRGVRGAFAANSGLKRAFAMGANVAALDASAEHGGGNAADGQTPATSSTSADQGMRRLTLEELSVYDGRAGKTYIGVLGKVHDVTSSPNFEPGQGYSMWAGKDATYALATLSLNPEDANKLDWEISDFNTEQLRALQGCKLHFSKYPQVGVLAEYEGRCLELPVDVVGDVKAPNFASMGKSEESTPTQSASADARAPAKTSGFTLYIGFDGYSPEAVGRKLREAADAAKVQERLVTNGRWHPTLSVTDALDNPVRVTDLNSGALEQQPERFPLCAKYTPSAASGGNIRSL